MASSSVSDTLEGNEVQYVISAGQKAQLVREVQALQTTMMQLKKQNAALTKELQTKNKIIKQMYTLFQQDSGASNQSFLESLKVELNKEKDKKKEAEQRISFLESIIKQDEVAKAQQTTFASLKRHLSKEKANIDEGAANKIRTNKGQD